MSISILTRRAIIGILPRANLRTVAIASLVCMANLLSACGGSNEAGPTTSPSPTTAAALSPAAALGEKIFKDVSLSASGRMSCASCHNPATAHAPDNALAVQLGGANLDVPGFRATPSLRYLNLTPSFFFDSEGTPTGGFTRDGRAQSLAQQAAAPLLGAHEMANMDKADVVVKLQRASYANEFEQVFGTGIFAQAEQAFDRLQFALQQYQKEDADFHPYDSKYDQFLAAKVTLSDAELRGLALFNNPTKGNCAACHSSSRGTDGSAPLFTDFTYDNLGVPRNTNIPATADAQYFDLGLCGPDRLDLSTRGDLCGAFKVPTLRNVATRKVFFHNGVITSLRDAVRFYVRRDTNPAEWYPVANDGSVNKFNDLPPQYRNNVNQTEAPYNRSLGMAPALNDDEIDDVVQFLGTLSDGYQLP